MHGRTCRLEVCGIDRENHWCVLRCEERRTLEAAHEVQLLHYLRSTEIEIGLLLNFGPRPQFRRLLFDNVRKKIRGNPCESVARVSA